MNMRMLFLSLAAVFFAGAVLAEPQEKPQSKIRDFDLKTLEALGRQIYKQDSLAWKATDALAEKFPGAEKTTTGGWVTIPGEETSKVYFLREGDGGPTLAYLITCPAKGDYTVEDVGGKPVPDEVLLRYHARKTAIAAVMNLLSRSGHVYNFEVLSDPTRKGFIVYALESTEDANEIMAGRHFRISVSEDGMKATDVDALTNSELILQKHGGDVPKGSDVVGYSMSQIVSDKPVETYVFLSLQNKLPFYIATGENDIWKVSAGHIEKMDVSKFKKSGK